MIGGRIMYKERCFTIFGGTGDLTFRKLIPAFYNMTAIDEDAAETSIVIVGRRDYTSESYREAAYQWVKKFARFSFKDKIYQKLAERIVYYRMDFTDVEEYQDLETFYQDLGVTEHIFLLCCRSPFLWYNSKWIKAGIRSRSRQSGD